jgi:hypothetical protein
MNSHEDRNESAGPAGFDLVGMLIAAVVIVAGVTAGFGWFPV